MTTLPHPVLTTARTKLQDASRCWVLAVRGQRPCRSRSFKPLPARAKAGTCLQPSRERQRGREKGQTRGGCLRGDWIGRRGGEGKGVPHAAGGSRDARARRPRRGRRRAGRSACVQWGAGGRDTGGPHGGGNTRKDPEGDPDTVPQATVTRQAEGAKPHWPTKPTCPLTKTCCAAYRATCGSPSQPQTAAAAGGGSGAHAATARSHARCAPAGCKRTRCAVTGPRKVARAHRARRAPAAELTRSGRGAR